MTGRRHRRSWRLGNRSIDERSGYLSGRIGYRSLELPREKDVYDEEAKKWRTEFVEADRAATAPFVLVGDNRFLYVAKHPTFSETTVPSVFTTLLTRGETARVESNTEWAVEAILDPEDFDRWLSETPYVDKVLFVVKLPTPDAAGAFEQLAEHLRVNAASEPRHELGLIW